MSSQFSEASTLSAFPGQHNVRLTHCEDGTQMTATWIDQPGRPQRSYASASELIEQLRIKGVDVSWAASKEILLVTRVGPRELPTESDQAFQQTEERSSHTPTGSTQDGFEEVSQGPTSHSDQHLTQTGSVPNDMTKPKGRARVPRVVFVLNPNYHPGLITHGGTAVGEEHPDIRKFRSINEAKRFGCSSKGIPQGEARKVTLNYPDGRSAQVAISSSQDVCDWDKATWGAKQNRDAQQRIWDDPPR